MRQTGDNVAAYLAELKRLSKHCKFGDTLNDMLRDRIVCSIEDQLTQRKLLAKPELTLKKAFEVVQTIVSVDNQVQELQHPAPQQLMHAVSPQFRPF